MNILESGVLWVIRRVVMGAMLCLLVILILAQQVAIFSDEFFGLWGIITVIVFIGGAFSTGMERFLGYLIMFLAIIAMSMLLVPWVELGLDMLFSSDFWWKVFLVLIAVVFSDVMTRAIFGEIKRSIDSGKASHNDSFGL